MRCSRVYNHVVGVLGLVLMSTATAGAADVVVTGCFQEIPNGATAVLDADLDCSGTFTTVYLGHGATFDLQGHTLTMGVNGVLCGTLKECFAGDCTRGGCTVENGTIKSDYYRPDGSAIGGRKVTVNNVTFDHNSVGIYAKRIIVSNSTFDHPLGAMNARRSIDATNVQVLGGGNGILAGRKVEMHDSYSESPIQGPTRVRLFSTTVTGVIGAPDAVIGTIIVLKNSSVTGNGLDPRCGGDWPQCSDIFARRRPRLDATSSCEHSLRPDGTTWGVCSLD
jgi:hypothetical protein